MKKGWSNWSNQYVDEYQLSHQNHDNVCKIDWVVTIFALVKNDELQQSLDWAQTELCCRNVL